MSTVRATHREAMELLDQSEVAGIGHDTQRAASLLAQAFDKERSAARLLLTRPEVEPTRSMLFGGAAILALRCGETREAERLAAEGLAGDPPDHVAEELRGLLEKADFQRHLDLRGIALAPDEVQIALVGSSIAPGMAGLGEVRTRLDYLDKLVLRTAERRRNVPFRESGRPRKQILQELETLVSMPRAASFAVTLRVAAPPTQPQLPGLDDGSLIIDDIMAALDLYNRADDQGLKVLIPEVPYYRNFVGLAQEIAPDGEMVRMVGFTAVRRDEERRVLLTRVPEPPVPPAAPGAPKRKPGDRHVTVIGELLSARSRRGQEGRIKVEEPNGAFHYVIVPEGLMADVVRPLYEEIVAVSGTRSRRGILLEGIRKVSEDDWQVPLGEGSPPQGNTEVPDGATAGDASGRPIAAQASWGWSASGTSQARRQRV